MKNKDKDITKAQRLQMTQQQPHRKAIDLLFSESNLFGNGVILGLTFEP